MTELDRALDGIELHAPVTVDDCRELHAELKRALGGESVDVVLRGTPDRKHDGPHRIEIRVGSHVRNIEVQP